LRTTSPVGSQHRWNTITKSNERPLNANLIDEARIDAEIRAIREEYSDEETEAAEMEAAGNAAALDVQPSLRTTKKLDGQLRRHGSRTDPGRGDNGAA